uniref:Bindin n=1 Tax=Parascaris univalens TaxID=6257 RepID=A0A915AZ01_PARUN
LWRGWDRTSSGRTRKLLLVVVVVVGVVVVVAEEAEVEHLRHLNLELEEWLALLILIIRRWPVSEVTFSARIRRNKFNCEAAIFIYVEYFDEATRISNRVHHNECPLKRINAFIL